MEALRAANRGMARAVCQGAKTAKRYAALGAGMKVDAQGYGREPTAMVRGVLSCLFVCLFVPNPLDQPQRVRRKEDPNNNALLLCHCNRNGVHIDSNSSARTHHNNIYMSSVLHFPIDGENTPLHHR